MKLAIRSWNHQADREASTATIRGLIRELLVRQGHQIRATYLTLLEMSLTEVAVGADSSKRALRSLTQEPPAPRTNRVPPEMRPQIASKDSMTKPTRRPSDSNKLRTRQINSLRYPRPTNSRRPTWWARSKRSIKSYSSSLRKRTMICSLLISWKV